MGKKKGNPKTAKKSPNTNPQSSHKKQNVQLTPQKTFNIALKMLTDWHIGCGAGRTGDIDSLVQRDKDGLPYIPAKTLTGIWRDACELLALGLDNGENNEQNKLTWQQWVEYLFGEQPSIAAQPIETYPRPAALSIRPAYLPGNFKRALKNKPQLQEALTFIKPGIQIEADTGCAKEDFLRFEEMVRGGTILEAQCELNLPDDENQKLATYALLIAATQLVERLGGKRRRGAGKCQLLVFNQDKNIAEEIQPWIEWLSQHSEPLSIPCDAKNSGQNTVNNQITEKLNGNWLRIQLEINTKSPLIISKRTVGNITETLDYIPGSHLLPIINRKLGNLGIDLKNAIANGDILVTNATLAVKGKQGRPIPLALFYEKLGGGIEKDGTVYNRFMESPTNNKQLKGYRAGYIGSTNTTNLPEYTKVHLTVGTHNTIEDEYQRPTSKVGGVYSYEAISSETKFKAEVRLKKSLADILSKKKQNWWEDIKGKDRVGQSKKDDYGAVEITVINQPPATPKQTITENSTLTVWLLSDVLLRDERLRPSTSIDDLAKELTKVLGIKIKTQTEASETLTFMARQRRVESWQSRWGLPRPSLVGLAAGSCAVFKIQDSQKIDLQKLAEKLAEIEASGIGERRAEGYGQICFNDPILTTNISGMKKKQDIEENNQPQKKQSNLFNQFIFESDPTFSYARIIEKSAWREAIHRASLFLAAKPQLRYQILGIKIIEQAEKKQSKPTMSQLGALRSILTTIEEPKDAKVILWLANLKETKNRLEKWDEKEKSLNIFQELLSTQNKVWEHLEQALKELAHPSFSQITLTSEGEKYLKKHLWVEAVNILVDACIRAHKRDLEKTINSHLEAQGVEPHDT